MRQHHDMGGQPAGPVDPKQHHDNALWEKRVDALMVVLGTRADPIMRVDELRRGIEELPTDAYDSMSYYERWIHSITAIMVERGILTLEEIGERVSNIRARVKENG